LFNTAVPISSSQTFGEHACDTTSKRSFPELLISSWPTNNSSKIHQLSQVHTRLGIAEGEELIDAN
jgi:hypothetical protein